MASSTMSAPPCPSPRTWSRVGTPCRGVPQPTMATRTSIRWFGLRVVQTVDVAHPSSSRSSETGRSAERQRSPRLCRTPRDAAMPRRTARRGRQSVLGKPDWMTWMVWCCESYATAVLPALHPSAASQSRPTSALQHFSTPTIGVPLLSSPGFGLTVRLSRRWFRGPASLLVRHGPTFAMTSSQVVRTAGGTPVWYANVVMQIESRLRAEKWRGCVSPGEGSRCPDSPA